MPTARGFARSDRAAVPALSRLAPRPTRCERRWLGRSRNLGCRRRAIIGSRAAAPGAVDAAGAGEFRPKQRLKLNGAILLFLASTLLQQAVFFVRVQPGKHDTHHERSKKRETW